MSSIIEDTLPSNLSDLLELALRDIAQVRTMRDVYRIDMGTYHEQVKLTGQVKCHVCLAGSVLAISLKADPTLVFAGGHGVFGTHVLSKLRAIDYLRQGRVELACRMMWVECPEAMRRPLKTPFYLGEVYDPVLYKEDEASQYIKWRQYMENMVEQLRQYGL